MQDRERYKSPFPLSDEHMRLVGIICAHWEALELTIQKTVAEIMEHDFHRVALLTENIGWSSKVDLIMVYMRPYQETDPPLWNEFKRLKAAVESAARERNKYVHARWKDGASPTTPNRVSVRTRGGKLRAEDEPVPIEDLARTAQEIWNTGAQFTAFFQRFGLLQA